MSSNYHRLVFKLLWENKIEAESTKSKEVYRKWTAATGRMTLSTQAGNGNMR